MSLSREWAQSHKVCTVANGSTEMGRKALWALIASLLAHLTSRGSRSLLEVTQAGSASVVSAVTLHRLRLLASVVDLHHKLSGPALKSVDKWSS